MTLIAELGGSETQDSKRITEFVSISAVTDFSAAQELGLRVAKKLLR
ncbi:MAG: hypothetical protein WDO06_05000 [Actinomycetota bacterium]